jgi:pimeloyl-ACP methyl ester carboxylesterase
VKGAVDTVAATVNSVAPWLPRQPVLLVNGDRDKLCVAQEEKFIAAAKRGKSHRFDCGHGVSLWQPQEFAALINAFALRQGQ